MTTRIANSSHSPHFSNMLYNKKLHKVQEFRDTRLPSVRDLFDRYGFSLMKSGGHPDNTDPFKFSDPVNPSVVPNIGTIELGQLYADVQREQLLAASRNKGSADASGTSIPDMPAEVSDDAK